MPNYKVIDADKLDTDLSTIANAIRTNNSSTEALEFPQGFVDGVNDISEDYLASVCNLNVTEIINSKITQIPDAFQRNSKALTKVSMSNLLVLPTSVFASCSALTDINFPKVTTINSEAFGSSSINKAYFPEVTTFEGWGYIFYFCRSLTKAYFPKLTSSIGDATFNNCINLETLVLGSDTFCALTDSNALGETPIAGYHGKTGYIYVKRALIDTYKAATNWSTYAAQFRAIEDYPDVLEGWE